ncbi:MAG: tRNA epoxyqueuosine(34) reductase QueG [Planctomycetaceae bacterium]|nr:tRNA epoxyqueuosine(34) reductase QueG [Planctomycetaceae bacterium]
MSGSPAGGPAAGATPAAIALGKTVAVAGRVKGIFLIVTLLVLYAAAFFIAPVLGGTFAREGLKVDGLPGLFFSQPWLVLPLSLPAVITAIALVGVTRAAPSARAAELRRWLADGKHGEMAWLAERVEEMIDVRTLVRGARSVVSVADRYHDGRPDRVSADEARPRGRIARYARGKDYHDVIRDRLRKLGRAIREAAPGCMTRLTGDIHPILEREQAARALLGAIGKHTLLIRPGLGSSFLLGEIVTDAEIAPSDAPPRDGNDDAIDPCGACTACIDACPTQAITPWSVDATRCTAYLTIEHRGEIPDEFFGKTGDWWFGCDICQEVCPHGQPTRASRRAGMNPAYAPRLDSIDLLEVLGWTEADRARLVVSSAIKRATLPMMKRNALLALASIAARDARLRAPVVARCAEIAADTTEDAIVRAAAQSCAQRLGEDPPASRG